MRSNNRLDIITGPGGQDIVYQGGVLLGVYGSPVNTALCEAFRMDIGRTETDREFQNALAENPLEDLEDVLKILEARERKVILWEGKIDSRVEARVMHVRGRARVYQIEGRRWVIADNDVTELALEKAVLDLSGKEPSTGFLSVFQSRKNEESA